MSRIHQSRPEQAAASPRKVLVWDLSVRIFHWALVTLVATAWRTGGSGSHWHEIAGGGVAGLIAYRLLWGVAGSRHARFTDFVKGPRAILTYVRALVSGEPRRYIGHNPAGAAMIVCLLVVLATLCTTGVMMKSVAFFGVPWVETVHETAATALIVLIPMHVLGAVVASRLHRENLIGAMVSGHKNITSETIVERRQYSRLTQIDDQVRGAQGFTVLMLLLLGGFAYGWNVTSRTIEIAADVPAAVGTAGPTRSGPAPEAPIPGVTAVAREAAPKPVQVSQKTPPPMASTPVAAHNGLPLAPFTMQPRYIAVTGGNQAFRLRGFLTGPSSVDGVTFRIDEATRLDDRLSIGDHIELRGYITADGALRAVRLRRR